MLNYVIKEINNFLKLTGQRKCENIIWVIKNNKNVNSLAKERLGNVETNEFKYTLEGLSKIFEKNLIRMATKL